MQLRQRTNRLIPAAALGGLVAFVAGGALVGGDTSSVQPTAMPCPTSITEGIYSEGCLPSVDAPNGAVDWRGPDEVPTLYGIPCTGSNIGKCIGLSRIGGNDVPQPDTSVRSNP